MASTERLSRSTTIAKSGCWETDLKDLAIPDGRRVRPAAFLWRVKRPDEFQEGDSIRATCGNAKCVRLEHLVRFSPPARVKLAEESTDKSGGEAPIIANEAIIRKLLEREADPELRKKQEEALAVLLARKGETE